MKPVYRIRREMAAWLLGRSLTEFSKLLKSRKLATHRTFSDVGPGYVDLIDAEELAAFAGYLTAQDIHWLSEWLDAKRRGESEPFAMECISMIASRNAEGRTEERRIVEARHRAELDDVIAKSLADAEKIRQAYDARIEDLEKRLEARRVQVDALTRNNQYLDELVDADRQTKVILSFSGLFLAGLACLGWLT